MTPLRRHTAQAFINTCWYKCRFGSREYAQQVLESGKWKEGETPHVYHCAICDGWHLGRERGKKSKWGNAPAIAGVLLDEEAYERQRSVGVRHMRQSQGCGQPLVQDD